MPSAHYVHPEFGYFCPGPGLRRVLGVAVVSILFGLIIGTSVIRLRAGHDRQADNAWTIAHIEPSRAATVLPAATEPGSSLTGNVATGAPNGALKPFPTRIVRVHPAKDRSPLAAVPLGRTKPAERFLRHRSLPRRHGRASEQKTERQLCRPLRMICFVRPPQNPQRCLRRQLNAGASLGKFHDVAHECPPA